MKKLGLIGGSGPESTLVYYKELTSRINAMTGTYPELVIESINLYKVSEYRTSSNLAGLKDYLLQGIRHLHAAGADIAALTAGTLHMVYDELCRESPLPLISIPEVVSEEAKRRGYTRLGLLGTDVTMEKDFLKKPFREKGMEVYVPEEEQRLRVNERIFNELENGILKKSTEEELTAIIADMQEKHGIEAVILGCTELPLILNENNCPVEVLDIMHLHIDELIRRITED